MENHFSILALRTPGNYESQKGRTLKDELPRSVGAQYATGEEWRNSSKKNEEMEPKRKKCPVVDVIGDGQRGLACCGSWGHKQSDMTEKLN